MSGPAYYNDNDPFAARWLRNLAEAGEIMAGTVDERSIHDVRADDVRGYERVHFFAGIAGWDLALRLAGWPPGRPVWTGSCPCQPYSAAGKGEGDNDPRNLWPVFFRLIRECRPECVIGEQVESAIGHGWLDRVCADLEGEGYAVGAIVLGAHSAGAPHIRQRLFWVADFSCRRFDQQCRNSGSQDEARESGWNEFVDCRLDGGLGDSGREGLARRSRQSRDDGPQQQAAQRAGGDAGGVGDTSGDRCRQERPQPGGGIKGGRTEGGVQRPRDDGPVSGVGYSAITGSLPGSHAGISRQEEEAAQQRGWDGRGFTGPGRFGDFWSDFDVIPCRDGKSRRVEPGTFPLAHGVPGRVGLLRGYGNAICVPVAAEFIEAYLDATSGPGA